MLPVLLRVGPFHIGGFTAGPFVLRSFSVFVLLGVLAGMFLISRLGKKRGFSDEMLSDLLFWTVLGGIVGTRVGFVVTNPGYYLGHPLESLMIWKGGLSLHGAIFGGMLAFLLYCWRKKVSPWGLGDLFTVAIPLGAAIGRIGCLLNERDDYGILCNPEKLPPWVCVHYPWDVEGSFRYPWPAFETLVHIPTFVIFYWLYTNKKGREGEFFFYYLIVYSIERFLLEYLRWGETAVVLANRITVAQVFSILIVGASLLTIFLRQKAVSLAGAGMRQKK